MRRGQRLFTIIQGIANRLFRSFIGKHGPVTSSTIARWMKSCLQKAGVDAFKFKAHSTRTAAATKVAMSGLTVE